MMPSSRYVIVAILVLSAGLITELRAAGASQVTVDVSASVNINSSIEARDSFFMTRPEDGLVGSASAANQFGSAVASGRANYGSLGIHASSDASLLCGACGTANATALWQDSFTVVSGTLPAGTPVMFGGSLTLTGSIDLENDFAGAIVQVVLSIIVDNAPSQQWDITDVAVTGGSSIHADHLLFGFSAPVGGTFLATHSLFGNLGTFADAFRDSSAVLNFLGTSTVTFFSQNPEAAYLTESGVSYLPRPSAVPEPSTLLFLGVGIAAIALIGRRHYR